MVFQIQERKSVNERGIIGVRLVNKAKKPVRLSAHGNQSRGLDIRAHTKIKLCFCSIRSLLMLSERAIFSQRRARNARAHKCAACFTHTLRQTIVF